MRQPRRPNLVVSGLLDYLEETGQRQLLPEVTQELERLLTEEKTQVITVTSAVPLAPSQYQELKAILPKIFKLDLPVMQKIDRNLLGGFTIKVADWFLDASLVQELAYLKKFMLT